MSQGLLDLFVIRIDLWGKKYEKEHLMVPLFEPDFSLECTRDKN